MSQSDRSAQSNGETSEEAGTAERVEARVESATKRMKSSVPLSRRQTLASLAGVGTLSAMSESADAQQGGQGKGGGSTRPWRSDVDAGGHELFNLGTLAMTNNTDRITDFAGANLEINGTGTLQVDDGPGSGLDADTLDGWEREDLINRIEELEILVEENRSFIEGVATTINSALAQMESYVNDDLGTVEDSINNTIEAAESDLNAVGDLLGEIFTVWVEEFEPVFDYLSGVPDGLQGEANLALVTVEDYLNNLIRLLNTQLGSMTTDVENAVDDLSNALQDVDSVVNSGLTSIENTVDSITSTIASSVNDIIDKINFHLPVNLAKIAFPELNLPELDLSSISVDLPDFDIDPIELPRIDVPSVEIPSYDVGDFSLPRISIPSLSLPRVDESVD